jgi:hypothetical protein
MKRQRQFHSCWNMSSAQLEIYLKGVDGFLE